MRVRVASRVCVADLSLFGHLFSISTWLLVWGQLCPLRCWTLGHHILDWFDSCLQYRRVILFFFGFYVIHLVV